jgi:ribonuclease D
VASSEANFPHSNSRVTSLALALKSALMKTLEMPEAMEAPISFSGKIHLINNDHDLESIRPSLEAALQLGFDTETRPSFKKGEVFKVALLQLSTDSDAYLIRLHFIHRFEILKKIFEREDILKVGVAIRDDLKLLQKAFSFTPKNFVELQELAKAKGLKNFGLKGMTGEVLNQTLSKGPKLTNWEAPTLTERQQLYAATDAWIGLKLFHEIEKIPIKKSN